MTVPAYFREVLGGVIHVCTVLWRHEALDLISSLGQGEECVCGGGVGEVTYILLTERENGSL